MTEFSGEAQPGDEDRLRGQAQPPGELERPGDDDRPSDDDRPGGEESPGAQEQPGAQERRGAGMPAAGGEGGRRIPVQRGPGGGE